MARVLIADGVTAQIERRVVLIENNNLGELLLTATCPHGVPLAKPQNLVPGVPVPVRLEDGLPQVRFSVWQPRCVIAELYTMVAPIVLIEQFEELEALFGTLPPLYHPMGSVLVVAE